MNQKVEMEWISCDNELPKMTHYRKSLGSNVYNYESDFYYVTVEFKNNERIVDMDYIQNGEWAWYNEKDGNGKVVAWLRELKPYTMTKRGV